MIAAGPSSPTIGVTSSGFITRIQHEGIIVCTDNPNFEELARKVNAALEGMDSLRGKLVRVNRGS